MSFYDECGILAAAGRLIEDDELRNDDERRDHQQLEIVEAAGIWSRQSNTLKS
jgi:hypothetical protein